MLAIIIRLGTAAAGVYVALVVLALVAGRVLPDGGAIVFDSSWNDNRPRFIYMVDVDRGTFHNLTTHQRVDGQPVLSPDGRRLAFASLGRELGHVVVTDLATGTRSVLENTINGGRVTWSADSREIVFEGSGTLNRADLDTGEIVPLTPGETSDWYPVWSPTDSRIAFISTRDTGNWQIYTIASDGRDVQRLTYTEEACANPAWSPDGRQIAFERGTGIYLMDADGTDPRPLSVDAMDSSWGPSWSPDGSSILFTAVTGENRDLYVANVTSGEVRRLTDHPALDQSGQWSPDGHSIVFESDRDSIYWGIYLLDVDSLNVRRLVDGNIGILGWWS